MRKRVLSLVLAIAMCFSMVSVVVTANEDMILMEDFGEIAEQYKDRVWNWQAFQFGAMTDEQTEVIDAAYDSYLNNKDDIKTIAGDLADKLITDQMLSNETMKDLYKWKLMRDLMDGRMEDVSNDDAYEAWFADFVAFEEANDEDVTPSAPGAALDNLGDYSADLTEYFGQLEDLVDNGLVFEGEGADKANAYIAAFDPNGDGNDDDDDMASIMDYLKDDVKELMVDGMVNAFDLGMKIATNQINIGLLERIPDRDMKGLFLIWGEDFANYVVDLIPTTKDALIGMNKEDLIKAILADEDANAPELISGDNAAVVDAMYGTMKAVAEYIAEQDFNQGAVAEVASVFDINANDAIGYVVDALRAAMDEIADGGEHGLELVHFNTYMGRELLRYKDGEELPRLGDAVIDGNEVSQILLGYAHTRYPAIENTLNDENLSLAEFDVEGSENGITVLANEDNIGQLDIELAENANGSVEVKVYRGYTDIYDENGELVKDAYVEDVYRYVTVFTVSVEAPYVTLAPITDPSVGEDGKVEVDVTVEDTNLDEIEVTVKDEDGNVVEDVVIKDKDGNELDPENISKEDFEDGIVIVLPEGVEPGDKFEVVVTKPGEDDELAKDDFTVVEDADEAEADATVDKEPNVDDPTVEVSGTTNLDEVKITVKDEEGNEADVVIKDKDGNVLDNDAVSKEDFEEGIVIELPEGVEADDKFTIVVKDPSNEEELDEVSVTVSEYYVELDDVLDTTVDGTITIKGTTNLDYVTVAIIKNGKTSYAVVYEKAEFEAGIELNAPDGAVEGEVYTVVVGTEKASDSDEFTITGAASEYYVELDDVLDTTVDGTITVKGETNLDYVTVAIIKNGKTIYAVVYEKAEFEAGIELKAHDGAVEGDVYTVVVGTEKAADSDDFTIIGDADKAKADATVDKAPNVDDPTVEVSGTTNLDEVKITVKDEEGNEVDVVIKDKDGNVLDNNAISKEDFEEGIVIELPEGVEADDKFTIIVKDPSNEEELDEESVTVAEFYVELDDVLDTTVDGTITIKGTTNLEHVTVSIVKGEKTIYAVVYEKAEFEAGITLNAPDGAVEGEVYTVVVGTEVASDDDEFTIVDVKPSGTLALAGSTTRNVKVNGTVVITTTPQNIFPEGATVEVVWTTEDGTIVEITGLSGDSNNIATITKLKKGTTTVTATLYVNGVAVDSKTVTIKTKSSGGSSSGDKPYTSITVKVDETKDVVKAPTNGTNVEFIPESGSGEVKVEIVDGVITVTGVKEGTVKGQLVVKNENGNVISTTDYEFIVTEGDKKPVDHECEWPDIAAGWEGKADAHWAHLTIDAMTINGYIKGYPDGLFKPDQNITRAEFSAIVYRILGLEDSVDGVYYDDTKGHWAEELIATMSLPEGYGMTRGYGDGNFGPNDFITREQAVAIIARAKSSVWVEAEEGAKDVFTDSEDISWWFDGEMDAAVTNGLITGYEDGSYKPLGFTTRAEACTLLARAWPEVLELN